MADAEYVALIDAVAVILEGEHECDEFYCGFEVCTEKRRQWDALEAAYDRARDSIIHANPGLDTPVPSDNDGEA